MNPEQIQAKERALVGNIRERILKNSFAYVAVNQGGPESPTVMIHTVGLCTHGLPEIAVLGNLEHDLAVSMITKLVNIWQTDGVVSAGMLPDFFSLPGNRKVPAMIEKIDKDVFDQMIKIDISFVTFFDDYEVVQLYWPDENGYLPTHPNYSASPNMRQPVLPTAPYL